MPHDRDTKGNPWAKLSQVKAGDILKADEGFSCIDPEAELEVFDSEDGLYVACTDGQHYLTAQADDDGEHLVGFYPT